MLKNPTPRQIAFAAALFISLGLGALLLLAGWLAPQSLPVWLGIAVPVVAFVLAYFVIIHYLKKYIYRKIKLIYKTIHKYKLTPEAKSQMVDVKTDIIEEVERQVTDWVNTQAREIAQLRSWQEYRRRFLGDISHELKTPIFNIQGYLETLLEGAIHDPKNNTRFLKKAVKNLDRLNTIVEDLDAIAKLESGDLPLDIRGFDIKELAAEVFEDLEIKADKADITLGFKAGADQNFRVRADREAIRQVLINLVNNSIKYGRMHGHTKVGFYDMDNYILVEVSDDGIGIAPEHLNHVFDRFYRVDKSRSRNQGGSGLGLSIVKHIIEAHHQTINVRSTPALGSTFGFTLEKA
ncbi:MAG: sensor histidine kinase [Bacteroidetes bacterium]|nr:MAG: sensor histidine kinase [Bacteroidota bacterium]